MLEFVKNVKKEARKVVFPELDEVKKHVLVVIGICSVTALLLWGVCEITLYVLRQAI